jgi:hypothetical protein
MDGQLHFDAPARGRVMRTLRVPVPERLANIIDRLEDGARAEFEARLPFVAKRVFDSIVEVRSLSDQELATLLDAARRDVDRYEAETARRAAI